MKRSEEIRFVVMDVMHRITLQSCKVAVGHHNESFFRESQVHSAGELEIIERLSPRKQREWLASRELLFQIAALPHRAECLYDDFGKPFLVGIEKYISVSHSGLWAAAMISDKPCGVDIQVYNRTVEVISKRFLSAAENTLLQSSGNRFHMLHVLWGAKECLYKAYGKRQLTFHQNIHIRDINSKACEAKGEIITEDIHLYYDVYYRLLPEAAWVFCIHRDYFH